MEILADATMQNTVVVGYGTLALINAGLRNPKITADCCGS
jgi:hypothetical protein